KTAQVFESRVCGADGYFTVHRTKSSSICDNRVGPTEPRIDHNRSVHADLPIVDMKPGERLCRSHEVVEIEADGAAGHIACRITIYFHIRHRICGSRDACGRVLFGLRHLVEKHI